MSVSEAFNVDRSTVTRLVARANTCEDKDTLATKPRSGRPPKIDAAAQQALHDALDTHNNDLSFRELASVVGVGSTTVWRHAQQKSWRTVKSQLRPHLTPAQKAARNQWAQEHRQLSWHSWVDVDEKYFHTVASNRPLKVPPGTIAPTTEVQHKSHVPKVLVLSAIAKPNLRHKFDGKVGFWRITETVVAKRRSKNYEKGDTYEKDTTMDSDKFVEVMSTMVFPAIRQTMRWAKSVTVQVDNAPAHTGKNAIARLNQKAAQGGGKPKILVVCQPPQSPDTNTNDLGFFHALQVRVEKQRGCANPFDKDALARRIQSAWDEFPQNQLTKLFNTKSNVLKKIAEHHGGNNFKLDHSS